MRPTLRRKAGRPALRSGLPAPVPGQPFSLIGTLRNTRRLLTAKDAAFILQKSQKTIYTLMREGKIPVASVPGVESKLIDPAAWLLLLEHDNPHLKASARSLRAVA